MTDFTIYAPIVECRFCEGKKYLTSSIGTTVECPACDGRGETLWMPRPPEPRRKRCEFCDALIKD